MGPRGVLLALALLLAPGCGALGISATGEPVSLVLLEVRVGGSYFATDGLSFVAFGSGASVSIRSKAPELFEIPEGWAIDEQLGAGLALYGRWFPAPELVALDPDVEAPSWALALP